MKILCVLNSPEGGATQGVLEFARAARGKVDLYAVVPAAPLGHRADELADAFAGVDVVPMEWWSRRLALPGWYRPLAWASASSRTLLHARSVASLRRIVRARGIDVVYSTSATIADGAFAARAAGVPHVWHIKEWIGAHARTRFALPDATLVRTISALSARVVVMTRFIGEIFERHGVLPDVVYDGVEPSDFDDADGSKLRAELDVGDDHVLVAMSASLRALWKRHDLFLRAAARAAHEVPDARFAIFGSTPAPPQRRAYARAHEQYLRLLGLQRELGVDVRMGIFSDSVPKMMRAVDLLVHPCDVEPFGRVAIEAMAARRPVVGPARGGIAESVVDGETGILVRPGDERAFAGAIAELARDQQRRARLGDAGRARVEELFTVERHAGEMLRVFEAARSSGVR